MLADHHAPDGAAGAGRGSRRPARALGTAVVVGAVLAGGTFIGALPASGVPSPGSRVAAAGAPRGKPRVKPVSYLGYRFEVPRSWPVVRLSAERRRCVRFDEHVVYLGVPGANQNCPSWLIGTTEAVLIWPGRAVAARSSVEDPTARVINVTDRRLRLTATFDTDPTLIYRILASAGLPAPVIRVPSPARLARSARSPDLGSAASSVLAGGGRRDRRGRPPRAAYPELPTAVTNYHGLGFDSCGAPSAGYMRAWRRSSRYRAIGIYIGGSDRACEQLNLTASWVRNEALAGWHFFPLYVGPQAAYGQLSQSAAARQGKSAAADAAVQAERLGFGPRTPIYYDMEAYPPSVRTAALRFISAWTKELHRLDFVSGVYSSSSSGIADLAAQYRRHTYRVPDVIDDALWNGEANTADPVFRRGEWQPYRRLHQYSGNVQQTFGGATIDIDQDYLDVLLPAPGGTDQASPAVTRPDGTIDVFYRGADNRLWREVRWAGSGWRRPVNMHRALSSTPSAVCVGYNVLDVFYRGPRGDLWELSQRAGHGWGRPRKLAMMGVIGSAPRAVAQPNGVIDVFWRGSADDHLWHGEYNPGRGWTGPQSLRGSLESYPSPVESSPGRTTVFWEGTDHQLWHVTRYLGGHWSRPVKLGMGPLGGSVHATAQPKGTIQVVWRGTAPHQVWGAARSRTGRWSGPRPLGGRIHGTPWPATVYGGVRVFWRGPHSQMVMSLRRARHWVIPVRLGPWRLRAAPFAAVGPPGGPLDAFWKGKGGHLWWAALKPDGRWTPPRSLGGRLA
jgi:Domain of unknown function (DUF1906)